MANKKAVASGPWSNTTTWDGGALPLVGDDVFANNFNVTIDVDVTVATMSNNSASGITAGGKFIVNSGRTVTCTTSCNGSTVGTYLFEGSAGSAYTVVSPSFTGSICSVLSGTTSNLIGNASTLNVPLNNAVFRMNGGTINWVGDCSLVGSGYLSDFVSGGTCVITGDILGGGGPCFWVRGTVALTLTGNISANGAVSVYDNTSINNTFSHVGSVHCGSVPAIIVRSSTGNYLGSGPFYNNGEVVAVVANRMKIVHNSATSWEFASTSPGETVTLYNPSELSGYPAIEDVRKLTVFGKNNEFAGTMDVVDATALAAELLTAMVASSDPLSTRLKNCATTASVNAAIASIPA